MDAMTPAVLGAVLAVFTLVITLIVKGQGDGLRAEVGGLRAEVDGQVGGSELRSAA